MDKIKNKAWFIWGDAFHRLSLSQFLIFSLFTAFHLNTLYLMIMYTYYLYKKIKHSGDFENVD